MDNWQAVQNWILFVPVVGVLVYYYYPRSQASAATKPREPIATPAVPKKKAEPKAKADKKPAAVERVAAPVQAAVEKVTVAVAPKTGDGNKKRKNAQKQTSPAKPAPVVQEKDDDDDAIDMSTKNFAMQMQKARTGQQISSTKNNEQRVKTVKQGNAQDKAVTSSEKVKNSGDVSDMLEPVGSAPTTLRVTAPAETFTKKEKKAKKQEEVETKKQRQNRQKVEERKLAREAEEKERKALEETQRRTAREARGEPAKNGIPAKAPTSSAWNGSVPSAAVNGQQETTLLDTFDAESTNSSNGDHGVSTAPSSTTDASEEEQMAAAIQQSNEQTGWTTVQIPNKKTKQKKSTSEEITSESITPKASAPKSKVAPAVQKTTSNGKPNGFQALEDTYVQRTDRDPMDASNWDA